MRDFRSAGCVFGELLLNRPLLPGKSELHQIDMIIDMFGSPTKAIWPVSLESTVLLLLLFFHQRGLVSSYTAVVIGLIVIPCTFILIYSITYHHLSL